MWYAARGWENSTTDWITVYFAPIDPADGQLITGWTAAYLDIIHVDNPAQTGEAPSIEKIVADKAMTSIEPTDVGVDYGASACDIYFAVIRKDSLTSVISSSPAEGTFLLVFKTDNNNAPTRIKIGILDMNAQDEFRSDLSALGDQHDWLRNDVENVIFPRLRRITGMLGENSVFDNFTFDDASNPATYRIRLFETAAGAAAATKDYSGADHETDEYARISVTETFERDRNTRGLVRNEMDTTLDDATTSENRDTDAVDAPGNTGSWPTGVNVT